MTVKILSLEREDFEVDVSSGLLTKKFCGHHALGRPVGVSVGGMAGILTRLGRLGVWTPHLAPQ